ncbi:MAG: hypothetical protein ACI9JR_003083, partial [Gammaproteobacteria bacterium]
QDANGKIILPGRVVASAGLDRVTLPNAPITLNAGASLFANSYLWNLVSSPAGSTSTLSAPNAMRTSFSADTEGDYTLRLTAASASSGLSKTDDVLVRIDSTLTRAPRSLTFYPDVSIALGSCATACHSSTGIKGIPVWWVVDGSQPLMVPIGDRPSLGFYEQVRARVNFENVADSLILKKPSKIHHYGGTQALNLGFDSSKSIGTIDRINYDLFVNWIAEGAVCGGTTTECPL